jgi:hypothetical protein
MILSKNLLLSDDQAVTASTESTNAIDLGVAGTPYGAVAPLNNDKGKGAMVPLLIQVTEDFNNLTSLTVAIKNRAGEGATGATAGVVLSQVITLANLKAGKQTAMCYVPKGVSLRYLALHYVVTGGTPSTGKITASVAMGIQTNVTGA